MYPYTSLVSSLQSLFCRHGFYHLCEHWLKDFLEGMSRSLLSDVYCGKLWKVFLQFQFQGISFFESKNSTDSCLTMTGFNSSRNSSGIGVSFDTCNCGTQMIRCALLGIGCDLPAGRKVCGFLSHFTNLGCSSWSVLGKTKLFGICLS